MAKSALNIQDSFLNQARKDHTILTVHLVDGSELAGKINAFDSFTVILFNPEKEEQYLVYKHSIATIAPAPRTLVHWNDGLQQANRQAMASGSESRRP